MAIAVLAHVYCQVCLYTLYIYLKTEINRSKLGIRNVMGGIVAVEIITTGVAGTMESSDIIVKIEPREEQGIDIELTSSVMQQFGKQIEKVIRETLEELGVSAANVDAVDKGALDCTVAARVATAAYRGAKREDYAWRVK